MITEPKNGTHKSHPPLVLWSSVLNAEQPKLLEYTENMVPTGKIFLRDVIDMKLQASHGLGADAAGLRKT
jgi:hypothetical protein